MNEQKSLLKDTWFKVGLILIPISFGIHLFLYGKNEYANSLFRQDDGIIFINYIISIFYFIGSFFIPITRHWFRFSKYNYQKFIVALILFSISCFTINIPFTVFATFGTWMNIYLIVIHLSLLTLCFHSLLPQKVKIVNFFVLGWAAVLTFYFTLYLAPLFIIAVFGALFFGLGLHLLVPAMLFTTILFQFLKRSESRTQKRAFYVGVILPFLILGMYLVKWDTTQKYIHTTQASIVTRPDNTLPIWVLLSQELDSDFFTERILKGNLVYETHFFSGMDGFGNNRSLGEIKEHDPLVVIGSELMGSIPLDRADRIKILESKFDLRHHTQRKLWSGKHLSTSSVLSNIQVFPDYRLAYTEKIIRIKNNDSRRGWNQQEEALYTFHLPEGSVATSLSLWIDGKEEKSRLTTKSKADSAYATIVGVEIRDPAILHWQEGNTITVYVFPCTVDEERMFKIGITTPLKYEDGKLVLQNIYFEGPDASNTLETSVVEFKSTSGFTPEMPSYFEAISPHKFQYTGAYHSYWEAQCTAPPLSDLPFSFNGHSYHVEEGKDQTQKTALHTVYLDLNKSWTQNEFDAVWNTVKDQQVWVFYDQLHRLTESNKDQFFESLHKLNFSLFPFHEVKDAEHSLVISKSTAGSPILKDLTDSEFIGDLKTYLGQRDTRIKLFSLSNELTPYLKTLKEFQVFHYTHGTPAKLHDLWQQEVFINDTQKQNTVKLTVSNTQIIRETTSSKSEAPDHLLRLFAYTKIMQDCGRNYFTSEPYVENDLIAIANEAYIVSPISSLIVLETKADYERFGIDENGNSLKNASTQSAGAVPEPHEWALIILLSCTLLFLYHRRINRLNTFE